MGCKEEETMTLEYEKKGKVAIFTLNRPEALNAIDPAMLKALSQAFSDFKNDDDLLVGIITGSGQRAFSIGADVKAMLPEMKNPQNNGHAQPPTIMRGLNVYKPLIAAINGAALGGGLELAMACDLRLASERAFMGLPEVNLGIIPGWGGTQRLMRLIPQAKASEMVLTGKPIDAREAFRIGLVNRVVEPDKLMDAAMEMAEMIMKPAPLAVRAAKQAMVQGLNLSLESGLRLEKSLFEMLAASRDFDEGCQAMLEKRKPEFKCR